MKDTIRSALRISMMNFILVLVVVAGFAKVKSLTKVEAPLASTAAQPSATSVPSVPQTSTAPQTPQTPPPPPPPPPAPRDLVAEVPQHNVKGDCWISYGGDAYDITGYFGHHPGGDAALERYCGKDATSAFNTKDKNPPQSHSNTAKILLSQFLVK